jgi:hypothetical protein
MVSDVVTAIASAQSQGDGVSLGSSSAGHAESALEPSSKNDPGPRHESYSYLPLAGKLVLGVGLVIGVVWFASQSGKNGTSPAPTYYPSAQPAESTAPVPSQTQSGNGTSVINLQPSQTTTEPQAATYPFRDRPPAGTNNVLTTAQIGYCLAERIRLDAATGNVNDYIQSDVGRFNAMVSEYNSRCGSFRYIEGSLESAKSVVERYRLSLQNEGRARFEPSPSVGNWQASPWTPPADGGVDDWTAGAPAAAGRSAAPAIMAAGSQPDAMVQALQRRLNELGYDAGQADGIAGFKTRAAISAFQRDEGLLVDGIASAALLARLNP